MSKQSHQVESEWSCVAVDPGVCRFLCTVKARKISKTRVSVSIQGSGCEHVQKMSQFIEEINLKELFLPITRNPVFKWAKQAKCHPACLVPFAILKAAEVEMSMALPRSASIDFK